MATNPETSGPSRSGSDPTLPVTVGPFVIEGLVGSGGMGEVFVARDPRLGRRVALKRVRDDGRRDIRRRKRRLRREARAVARLSHPSIVQIYDIVEEADHLWLVMEYVPGSTLSEIVTHGPRDLADVIRWGRQIAEGLAAAHEAGLLHRDLKAANVVIDRVGQARILDFGLAKAFPEGDSLEASGSGSRPSMTDTGQMVGTPQTMAPEQILGGSVGPRTDLFGLGVMLYQAIAGVPPFVGETSYKTVRAILTRQPVPLRRCRPECPVALERLVDRLLAKTPEHRPASAAAVAEILGELEPSALTPSEPGVLPSMDGAGVETVDEPGPEASLEAGARPAVHRRVLVAAGAALAVALIFLAGTTWDWREPPAFDERDVYRLCESGFEALERYDLEGRVEAAVADFERAVDRAPESASAHAGLAWALLFRYVEVRDEALVHRAVALAQEAVRLDPFLAHGHVALGLSLGRSGEHERALAALLRAEELSAGVDLYWARGQVLSMKNDLEGSERSLRRAVETDPRDLKSLLSLGTLYYRLGRWQDAELWWRAAVERAPDSIFARRNLASAHFALGRTGEAAAELQQALAIRPEASLYGNLGTVLFARGLYRQAADAYEAAIELAGGASNYLHWANLGDALSQIPGRGDEARRAFLRAAQIVEQEAEAHPEDLRLASRRVLYRAKMGDAETAVELLAAFDPAGIERPVVLYRLAVASEIVGRRDGALSWLERALDAGLALSRVEQDPDLAGLRASPGYHRMLAVRGESAPRSGASHLSSDPGDGSEE